MTYISVCKNIILSNLKNSTHKPAIRICKGKYGKPKYKHKFKFCGEGKIVYSMNHPMPWGARVWIELKD